MKNSNSRGSPLAVAALALLLLALGFLVGTGYQTMQYAAMRQESREGNSGSRAKPATIAPVVKGLSVSPDDRLLAFTAVYDESRRASRFLLDLKTGAHSAAESPRGWQDYIRQWSRDGRTLLFERERIPRPVADASPGIYQEKVWLSNAPQKDSAGKASPAPPPALLQRKTPEQLTDGILPIEERIIAGFWTPEGQLAVKTRRESKALYLVRKASPESPQVTLIDRAAVTYYQSRAARENGKLVFYVVRDVPGQPEAAALYRVENGQDKSKARSKTKSKARRISEVLPDVVWVYLSENARWMIVCRAADSGDDWHWTLYRVTPQRAQRIRSTLVPEDVIAVFWSPDFKHVLGAAGQSLWIIDVPSLQVHRLGTRTDWKADDAAWLNHSNAVIVAAQGKLWQVAVPSGAQRELWKFPDKYWR